MSTEQQPKGGGGAAQAPATRKQELLDLLATLTPQEKYEYGLAPRPDTPKSKTPKFSEALDRVAEADIPKVVRACRAGIAHVAKNPDEQVQALELLRQVSPAVAQAAQDNSAYRLKPLVHSLHVAATYLQSPEAAAKRAAAKLRVPVEP